MFDEAMLTQLPYPCEEDEEAGTNIIESDIQQVQVEDALSLEDICEEFFKKMRSWKKGTCHDIAGQEINESNDLGFISLQD